MGAAIDEMERAATIHSAIELSFISGAVARVGFNLRKDAIRLLSGGEVEKFSFNRLKLQRFLEHPLGSETPGLLQRTPQPSFAPVLMLAREYEWSDPHS